MRALMKKLNIESAHIVGHSYGANVAIALAITAPSSTLSLFVHEPPLFSLLTGNSYLETLRIKAANKMKKVAMLIEKGAIEKAARLFIEEVAFGKNSWDLLFDAQARTTILSNADTWLDQFRDPERLAVNVSLLSNYPNKFTLSTGTNTLPPYREVARLITAILPEVNIAKITDGAHGAHISHPEIMAQAIRENIRS